jgi:hypothetical protein
MQPDGLGQASLLHDGKQIDPASRADFGLERIVTEPARDRDPVSQVIALLKENCAAANLTPAGRKWLSEMIKKCSPWLTPYRIVGYSRSVFREQPDLGGLREGPLALVYTLSCVSYFAQCREPSTAFFHV